MKHEGSTSKNLGKISFSKQRILRNLKVSKRIKSVENLTLGYSKATKSDSDSKNPEAIRQREKW